MTDLKILFVFVPKLKSKDFVLKNKKYLKSE